MKDLSRDFERAYQVSLHEFLARDGESLERAYELGRQAMTAGLGLPSVASAHREVLPEALARTGTRDEARRVAEQAALFFSEMLGAYELTYQGFHDTVRQLRDLNRTLEQRVADRTLEAERARDEAISANNAKSEFLAVMSHEVRTPINAIIGYADLLLTEERDQLGGSVEERVGRIAASARHLMQLVEEVLSFARMEANRERLNLEEIDLHELAHSAAELIEPLAREKGLGYRVRVSRPSAPLRTDASKVRQILLNLLSNAVKFTDRGHISLCARVRDETVFMDVRDTGIGIDPEHRDRIFEAFWQVDATARRRAEGTGLGLSVSRQLARMLGGDITLAPAPHRGTRFTVRLPLRSEPE